MSDTRVAALKAHIASLEARIERLRQMAYLDEQTGIYTLRALYDLGQRELERARRFGRPLGLVALHVHGLVDLGKRHGSFVADELLTALAELCDARTRATDLVALLDEETLAILLPETAGPQVEEVATRLLEQVHRSTFVTYFGEQQLTICVGAVGLLPAEEPPEPFAALVERALAALEQAHAGEGLTVWF